MRQRTRIFGAFVACAAVALLVTQLNPIRNTIEQHTTAQSVSGTIDGSANQGVNPNSVPIASSKSVPLTVMAVGGSSAQGYDDPDLDGYLARALATVSTTLNTPITFINKAKSGQIPSMLAPKYDPLLHAIHPNIVIISWGLLNSISQKVPEAMFQRVIQNEVSMALKEGADVWIVTPPVTPATYVGHDVHLLLKFAQLEIAGARAVSSNHVHVFDLMGSMKRYLKANHLAYQPYESNNWHMNRAGHILAGKILAHSILQRAHALGLSS